MKAQGFAAAHARREQQMQQGRKRGFGLPSDPEKARDLHPCPVLDLSGLCRRGAPDAPHQLADPSGRILRDELLALEQVVDAPHNREGVRDRLRRKTRLELHPDEAQEVGLADLPQIPILEVWR